MKTDRLIITPTSQCSPEKVLDYHLRNRKYLTPFNPTPPPDFYTEAYWQRKIWASQQDWERDSAYRFALYEGEDSKVIIGLINYSQVFRGPLQSCFLGYSIDETKQSLGLMTEALIFLNEFMFKEKGLHRISANYLVDNVKSGRVLEKLGFEREGLAKKYLNINGTWQDHILTSKINPYAED